MSDANKRDLLKLVFWEILRGRHKMRFLLCCMFAQTIVFIVSIPVSEFAHADSYPTTGSVSHETDSNSINYDCSLQGDVLNCQFTQIMVMKPMELEALTADDLNDIDRAVQSAYEGKEGRQMCSFALATKAAIGSGDWSALEELAVDNPQIKLHIRRLRHLNDFGLTDAKRYWESVQLASCQPSAENGRQLVELSRQRQAHQCRIYPNTWSREFRRSSTSDRWVATEGPSGICRVVNVSEFYEPIGSLWSFRSRKIVSNKEGENLGMQCADLDETEQSYTWNREPIAVGCDIISFGVF